MVKYQRSQILQMGRFQHLRYERIFNDIKPPELKPGKPLKVRQGIYDAAKIAELASVADMPNGGLSKHGEDFLRTHLQGHFNSFDEPPLVDPLADSSSEFFRPLPPEPFQQFLFAGLKRRPVLWTERQFG